MAEQGLKREDVKSVFATGAGRVMVKFANEKVTEMSAGAKGVSYFFPTARTIVDVGAEEGRGIKTDGTGKAEYVHTLNGSGLAVGRTLVAISPATRSAPRAPAPSPRR